LSLVLDGRGEQRQQIFSIFVGQMRGGAILAGRAVLESVLLLGLADGVVITRPAEIGTRGGGEKTMAIAGLVATSPGNGRTHTFEDMSI